MSQTVSGGRAHKALVACAAGVAIQLAATAAWAQATPATPAADGAPSEAARRAAASPYRFILQHASSPARKAAPAPVVAPPPAVETRRAPAESPVQSAARTPAPAPMAIEPPPVAAEPAPAPAAAKPAEAMQAAARVRAPEPPPPRREVIPIRTDEPRLSAMLMRERPNGVVRVQFEIHPDGSTKEVKVVSSSNRSLNRATVDAISAWKFQPVDEVLTVETEVAYKYD